MCDGKQVVMQQNLITVTVNSNKTKLKMQKKLKKHCK